MDVLPPRFRRPRMSMEAKRSLLLETLRGRKEWMTAEQIGFLLGWSDRTVRDVASECVEVVSRPGGDGYMLELLAPEEEFNHCINALFAQARAMIGRAVRLKKARKARQLDGGLLPL